MCVSIFPSPDACAKVWPAAPNTRAVMAMLIRIGFNSSLTALPQLLYEFRILMITGNHMQFHLCWTGRTVPKWHTKGQYRGRDGVGRGHGGGTGGVGTWKSGVMVASRRASSVPFWRIARLSLPLSDRKSTRLNSS